MPDGPPPKRACTIRAKNLVSTAGVSMVQLANQGNCVPTETNPHRTSQKRGRHNAEPQIFLGPISGKIPRFAATYWKPLRSVGLIRFLA